ADALNISRVTVSKAFNNQAGVSDSLRELIFAKAKELGYAKLPYQIIEQPQEEQRTISLIVSRPDSALFWTNIIHRMAQELANYNVNLLYTYVPSVYSRGFSLPSILTSGNVDGIVVLNVYDEEILNMVNALPMPKVFLDTIPSLTDAQLSGDLILIEGFRTEARITDLLIQSGHAEIGFLGDIDYAMTNKERYLGFCDCMAKHELIVRSEYCLTGRIDIFSYDRKLYAFLDELKSWPTAFVCASDYVANFVQAYLDNNAHRLPHPVVLTGFDNMGEYTNVAGRIITANVPTELLGKRLALQLLFRSEHPEAPYELIFVKPSIMIPYTTE
ncbi:MAG: LacI family DNA-binding transcriptional regulator, partial [Lachnospiraceae bacterium]|nr:LacI family DNA-binding transcriptional regulator [Lachnospiraceae bacterium]